MKVLILEIMNWKAYNPRTDVKSASWFRLSNRFFIDPDFYGQPLVVRTTWLFLLCEASSKMSPLIKINTKQIADGLSSDDLIFGSQQIEAAISSILTIRNSKNQPILTQHENINDFTTIESGRESASNFPLQTDKQTNVTNVTDECTHTPKVFSIADCKKSFSEKSSEILEHWNTHPGCKTHNGSETQLRKIEESLKKLLKNYSLEEIKQGVTNYFLVVNGDEFFYSHKFSCWDFLARKNNENFMPGLFTPETYLKFGAKNITLAKNEGQDGNSVRSREVKKPTTEQIQLLKEAGQL